jgi:filamentous hemagglutinin family protein
MAKAWLSRFWQFGLINSLTISSAIAASGERVFAQIQPDSTLGDESSVVNSVDANSDRVDGGAIRGNNLLHSFSEFNVGEGKAVYFANPGGIENIFSRVTGSNPSNILGKLGVLGDANLFLLNPNGIIFGENASLDVQGSFTATTADGIEFGDRGSFSADTPETPGLLTINPSAYLFNQIKETVSIQNQSSIAVGETSQGTEVLGLRVPDGKNLFLLGGNITLDSSRVNAFGGRVELGGLKEPGKVAINADGSLIFPDNVARGDVSLTNRSRVEVLGDRGSIKIQAGNIILSDLSFLFAGIESKSEQVNPQAGNIILNATDNIEIIGRSSINNSIGFNTTGNAGNIEISSDSLLLDNSILNSNISGSNEVLDTTAGRGNTGNISIRANDSITANSSSISNIIGNGAIGNGGDITIKTGSLSLLEGAVIRTEHNGEGNLGNIDIQAKDSVFISGTNPTFGRSQRSSISNTSAIDVLTQTREGGNIIINARSISLADRASINTIVAKHVGTKGEIILNASEDIRLSNRSLINTTGSNITIDATGKVFVENSDIASFVESSNQKIGGDINVRADALVLTNPFLDSLRSRVRTETNNTGNGGNLNINVRQLTLQEGSYISTSTFPEAQGKGGNLTINASEFVELIGNPTLESPPTSLLSQSGGAGDGGNITVETNELIVRDGAGISTQAFAEGQGGDITIMSPSVKLIGSSSTTSLPSGLFAQTSGLFTNEIAGDAGDIKITSEELTIQDGAWIEASTSSEGRAGDITIKASDFIKITGSSFRNLPSSVLTDVSSLDDSSIGIGNAGNITIDTNQLIVREQGQINAQTESQGNAGTISVTAQELLLDNAGLISTRSSGNGNAGNIILNVIDTLKANNSNINTSSEGSTGGQIYINAGNINLKGNSDIRTNVNSGANDGGNIALTADSIIIFDDSDIFAFARDGKGGNITLDTPAYFGNSFTANSLQSNPNSLDNNDRADLNATGAVSGVVTVPDVSFIQNSLADLPDNAINTENLIANSCVVRDRKQEGKFIITGKGGLPENPADVSVSSYPTGDVRGVDGRSNNSNQSNDAIVEPQGLYRLTNGQLVLSRECSR